MSETADKSILEEQTEMIEKFQCIGCTCGSGVEGCLSFEFEDNGEIGCLCSGHSAGTFIGIGVKIALGLPKGFNRVGTIKTGFEKVVEHLPTRSTNIRLVVDSKKHTGYDKLNVPVWAMEEDGYLFVRVVSPRINYNYVDVIKGGKIKDICPHAINVAEFIDEID